MLKNRNATRNVLTTRQRKVVTSMSLTKYVISRKLVVWGWVISTWCCGIASASTNVQEQHLGTASGTSEGVGTNRVVVQLIVRDPVVFMAEKQNMQHMPERLTIADALLVRSSELGVTLATRAYQRGAERTNTPQGQQSTMLWDLSLYIDGNRAGFQGLTQESERLELAIPDYAERVELRVSGPLRLTLPAGQHGDYTATLHVTGSASE